MCFDKALLYWKYRFVEFVFNSKIEECSAIVLIEWLKTANIRYKELFDNQRRSITSWWLKRHEHEFLYYWWLSMYMLWGSFRQKHTTRFISIYSTKISNDILMNFNFRRFLYIKETHLMLFSRKDVVRKWLSTDLLYL